MLRDLNGDFRFGPMTAAFAPDDEPDARGKRLAQRHRFRLALAATVRHIRVNAPADLTDEDYSDLVDRI